MSKPSKIIIIIFAVLAIILAGSAYRIMQERYSNDNSGQESPDSNAPSPDVSGQSSESQEENPEPDAGLEETKEIEEDVFLEVTSKDCEDRCAKFKNDAENLKYCQEICGLSSLNKKVNSCQALDGLDKDYCLKDMAIQKKNFSQCSEIEDKGIQKACKDRVTEEVLEQGKL